MKLRVNELINIHGIENSAQILAEIKEESKFSPFFSTMQTEFTAIKNHYSDASKKKL